MYMIAEVSQYVAVASFAEAWIEILMISITGPIAAVASFAEAWIEINRMCMCCIKIKTSPPSRRRGLKFYTYRKERRQDYVASFAEAWIEISITNPVEPSLFVASFAEAWIEIVMQSDRNIVVSVASFAEAWIEISSR